MMSVRTIAVKNITYRKFQSIVFVFFVFISTIALFLSLFCIKNMRAGISETNRQLSADILIVPSSYDENAKGVLFEGKSCTILFDENPVDTICDVDGVAQVSSQLFMETLSLSCCSSEDIEVIAINPDTDFSVQSWIAPEDRSSLSVNEVIIGSDIGMKKGDTITLYGDEYHIARVLPETGMGYDTAVFMSFDSAKEIISSEQYGFLFDNKENPISLIDVSVQKDADIEDVASRLRTELAGKGVSVYTVSSLIGMLYDKLHSFEAFGLILNGFIVITVSAALFTLVTLSIRQRQNRIGSFLSVGIPKSRIINMFIYEYLYLLLTGYIFGVILVCIFVYPLYPLLSQIIDIPYKTIDIAELLAVLVCVLAVNLLMMGISVSFSFIRIIRQEPAVMAEEQV